MTATCFGMGAQICIGFVKFFVCVLLASFVAGCSMFGGARDKPVPAELGLNVAVLSVRQAWTAQIGKVEFPLQVYANDGKIAIASSDGTVAALDGKTGEDVWRTRLGEPLSAGVGSDGRTTAVVTRANALVALDSGREKWRQVLSAQVFTPPLVAGGRVFVLSADRSVAAYDGSTGQRLWSQQRVGEPLVLKQSGVLTVRGNMLIVGLSGRMVGVNPNNGSVLWEAAIASPRGTNDVERLVELVGPSHRAGDNICTRVFQAAVGCVNTVRGAVMWSQAANGADGVHGDERTVFGTESNGVVTAWNRLDGARIWSTDRFKYRQLTAPLLLGRSVVFGDGAGLVHFVSREDGSPLNRMSTDGSGISAAPVVASDTLVIVSRNGSVYGFRPE